MSKISSKDKDLSKVELAERVAILKRFKYVLEKQREKFRHYLQVLEAQELSIENENINEIVQHAELGRLIVSEISNIKKVIDPLEILYKNACQSYDDPFVAELETERLKQDLKNLQTNILAQNRKNRDKIKKHLIGLRKQVVSIKSIENQRGIFANDEAAYIIDFEV